MKTTWLPLNQRFRAFTLVELLTVIAIIGILAAIIIPVVGQVRRAAKAGTNSSNIRQLTMANILFEKDHGRFASGNDWTSTISPGSRNWHERVAPCCGFDKATYTGPNLNNPFAVGNSPQVCFRCLTMNASSLLVTIGAPGMHETAPFM